MIKLLTFGLVAVSTMVSPQEAASIAAVAPVQVPAPFRGIWAKDGRCDIAAYRLRITARRAGWGSEALKPVVYSPDDKTVGWQSEYDAATFEIGGRSDTLVYNKDGGNMPSARELYVRCSLGMKRMPVPHK